MRVTIEPIIFLFLIELEHAILWIKQVFNKQLKEFFPNTALINPRLSHKLYLERLPEIEIRLNDFVQCII
jgi:hypothetical protein